MTTEARAIFERNRRRQLLAAIHAEARRAGLSEEARRDRLEAATGKRSCRAMSLAELARAAGAVRAAGAGGRPVRPRESGPADRPLLRAVYALLGSRPAAYAEAILRRMHGAAAPARLAWASDRQLRQVVAALSIDQRRRRGRP